MKINFMARQIELTDETKALIMSKTDKLEKLFDNITRLDIKISKEPANKYKVEMVANVTRKTLVASVLHENILSGAEQAIDKLERQIDKVKTKMQNKR